MCKEKESAVEVKRHLERQWESGQETAVDWKSSWHGAEAQVPNPT